MPRPSSSPTVPPNETSTGVRIGNYRWMICALLFFAATINYIDRQVIGILKPALQKEFGWGDERVYASIVFSFQLAYAIGFLFVGRFMDKVGTRIGFAICIVVWSIAAVAHAGADMVTGLQVPMLNLDAKTGFSIITLGGAAAGFALARFLLGLGEAGNFPGLIKTVAEWFPKKERALATGIFNSGTNVGALATPLLVPWLVGLWGWKSAFIVRVDRLRLAGLVVDGLSVTAKPSKTSSAGIGLHPKRPIGHAGSRFVVQAADIPANLGVRNGKIPDRPCVVALSILGSRLSQ